MFKELERDNLSEILAENELVHVQYSAGWCGNCRIMKPKFKKFGSESESALYAIVDAEKFPESRKLAQVDNLPTFATFRKGELVGQVQTNKIDSLKTFLDETSNN